MKTVITTRDAPSYALPVSQGIRADGLVFASGQVGTDPATGQLVSDEFEPQARRALENVRAVLTAAGCTLASVVKVTVWLVRKEDFPSFNAIYSEYFTVDPPARSALRCDLFLAGALVELEAIAVVPQ
jgi:2-iminobutanoate/2-iminopropanoate deaminase